MLMMRHERALVMARRQALLMRYTDLRLVFRMTSHSSSDMRSNRLSRVMPALLTRIVGAPPDFSISDRTAAIDSALFTSSIIPFPATPFAFSAALIFSAPSLEVAVPNTCARSEEHTSELQSQFH